MPHRQLHPDSPWLLALLAALVALGPLSVDMYLPAMPSMMRDFGTDIGRMHLTLSSYLTGFALFHLACGPLADARLTPLLETLTADTASFQLYRGERLEACSVGELAAQALQRTRMSSVER